MKIVSCFALSAMLCAAATCTSSAQIYDTNGAVVQTFAGSGFYGFLDGQGQQTLFNGPTKMAVDSFGNFFVVDNGNYRIRKITPSGLVSTFVGGGTTSPPSVGTNASLSLGYSASDAFGSITIDRSNVLWVTTPPGLLKIGPDASVSLQKISGLGKSSGVCVDSSGNVYFSTISALYPTPTGNQIYRINTNGVVELFAGSGNSGHSDGNWIFSSFSNPTSLAADSSDNIFVFDSSSYLLRKINQNRDVVTIAGFSPPPYGDFDGLGTNAAFFGSIYSMCSDGSGGMILACNYSIRKIDAQNNVTTIAGNFSQSGYTNGIGRYVKFAGASGVCLSGGAIYISDSGNHRIRSISFNPTQHQVPPTQLEIGSFAGIKITGDVGRSYRVESSTDAAQWQTETTLVLTASPFLWIDSAAMKQNKFYRAFLLP